jgi:lysozyme
MMKKLVYILALWFLLDWAYKNTLKPFIQSEFGVKKSATTNDNDSTGKRSLIPEAVKPILSAGEENDSSLYTVGLDVYHGQGDELKQLRSKDRIRFVICKATEGITHKDSTFDSNWNFLKTAKIIRGAYHFYVSTDNPTNQANFFSQVIQDLKDEDLPPVLDIEEPYVTGDVELAQKGILEFLQVIESKTGRKPMLYTNLSTGNKYLNDDRFADYPVWVADYTPRFHPPQVPKAWKHTGWVIWQRTDKYKFDHENNDFDIFKGSLADLNDFIKKSKLN